MFHFLHRFRYFFLLFISWARSSASENGGPVPYPLVVLEDYVEKLGARCLDGSPPSFYVQKGLPDSWIIDFEGGGWCYNLGDCLGRSGQDLGSSKNLKKDGFDAASLTATGLLDRNSTKNPDFWNFTKVFVNYCDGLSFTGDRADPVADPKTGKKIWFRGAKNLEAVFTELNLSHGLDSATRVIVSGNSAGGLTVYLHLDKIRSMLPQGASVLGFPDGGFFLDAKDINGEYSFRASMNESFVLSNGTAGIAPRCAAANMGNEWRCLFPQYAFQHVETPLFALQSSYDAWQIPNIFKLPCVTHLQGPPSCTNNASAMALFHSYHKQLLLELEPVLAKAKGTFVDSCLAHCQATVDGGPIWNSAWKVDNRTIAQSFGDCYFGRGNCQTVQRCEWPCNPTCYNAPLGLPLLDVAPAELQLAASPAVKLPLAEVLV